MFTLFKMLGFRESVLTAQKFGYKFFTTSGTEVGLDKVKTGKEVYFGELKMKVLFSEEQNDSCVQSALDYLEIPNGYGQGGLEEPFVEQLASRHPFLIIKYVNGEYLIKRTRLATGEKKNTFICVYLNHAFVVEVLSHRCVEESFIFHPKYEVLFLRDQEVKVKGNAYKDYMTLCRKYPSVTIWPYAFDKISSGGELLPKYLEMYKKQFPSEFPVVKKSEIVIPKVKATNAVEKQEFRGRSSASVPAYVAKMWAELKVDEAHFVKQVQKKQEEKLNTCRELVVFSTLQKQPPKKYEYGKLIKDDIKSIYYTTSCFEDLCPDLKDAYDLSYTRMLKSVMKHPGGFGVEESFDLRKLFNPYEEVYVSGQLKKIKNKPMDIIKSQPIDKNRFLFTEKGPTEKFWNYIFSATGYEHLEKITVPRTYDLITYNCLDGSEYIEKHDCTISCVPSILKQFVRQKEALLRLCLSGPVLFKDYKKLLDVDLLRTKACYYGFNRFHGTLLDMFQTLQDQTLVELFLLNQTTTTKWCICQSELSKECYACYLEFANKYKDTSQQQLFCMCKRVIAEQEVFKFKDQISFGELNYLQYLIKKKDISKVRFGIQNKT